MTMPLPDPPAVYRDGAVIGLRASGERTRWYNRDDLATAYLLWLDTDPSTPKPDQAWQVRTELMSTGELDHREAWALTIAASMCLTHNIEP
ncbi:hypothetical protein [Micromonospora carbonacea]|uniref:hypothetical protein n=1 Tax=Micromonospora carbonacea TaxID=47853 RepID=UPI003714C51F